MTTTEVFSSFDTAWCNRYGRKYLGFGAKLGRLARPLIEAGLTRDEIAAAAVRYVQDDDPYLVERRHPFELFAATNRINQYLVEATPGAGQATIRDASRAAFLARMGVADDE